MANNLYFNNVSDCYFLLRDEYKALVDAHYTDAFFKTGKKDKPDNVTEIIVLEINQHMEELVLVIIIDPKSRIPWNGIAINEHVTMWKDR